MIISQLFLLVILFSMTRGETGSDGGEEEGVEHMSKKGFIIVVLFYCAIVFISVVLLIIQQTLNTSSKPPSEASLDRIPSGSAVESYSNYLKITGSSGLKKKTTEGIGQQPRKIF